MLCPCCGRPAVDLRQGCVCGARAIGDPDTTAIASVRRIGPAMLGFGFAALGVGCIATKFLIPAVACGLYFSVQALRRIRLDRSRFSGARLAKCGLIVSAAAAVILVVAGGVKVNRWREGLIDQERAATRARMMELAIAFNTYKRVHGSFPGQLDELRAEGLLSGSTADSWGKTLTYKPTGRIAAVELNGRRSAVASSGPGLTQYQLTSAGADGTFGTKDDIILNDDVFAAKR